MQTQGTSSFIKLSNTKPQDNQSRGFKPVISIPIVVQPQNPQSHNTQLKDTNLPLEIKLNNFYQEYLKLVKEHKLIRTTIDHVNRQKAELEERFNSLQVICQIIKYVQKQQIQGKKKRHRRNANQIVRSFQCPIQTCDKSYGAEASLSQHIKLKHKSFYESQQYEAFMLQLNKKQKQQENE